MEMGYRSHRFPYLKPGAIKNAKLSDGDMVALITNTKGLDATHVGFIKIVDGVPHLLHASSKAGKVIIDPLLRHTRDSAGLTSSPTPLNRHHNPDSRKPYRSFR